MSFKKELKKTFSDSDKLLDLRYESVGIFFLISVLIFSLNFFFVWAKFYLDFNLSIFTFIYTIFVLSISVWFFFLLKWSFRDKVKWGLAYFTWFVCFLVFLVMILPVVMPREELFNFIWKYL